MLTVSGVTHSYGDSIVLRDVSFTVPRGQVLGLVGPNGSGKTTLLRALYGSLLPGAGSVTLDGREVRKIPARELARRIGVVVQEPVSDLSHTVADVVLMGRIPHRGLFGLRTAHDEELAVQALDRTGVLHLASRGFDEISGGERQRVLLARALTQEAGCLLLDEPTNHLDISFQHQLLHLVRDLGVTAVVVLHDLNLAARYCDSLVMLAHGAVQAIGAPDEVLAAHRVEAVYGIDAEDIRAVDGTLQLLFSRGAGVTPPTGNAVSVLAPGERVPAGDAGADQRTAVGVQLETVRRP